jgi:hypothetical protein
MIAAPTVEQLISQGVAPRLAEMLAAQTPPGAISSRGYEAGREGFKDFDRLPKPVVEKYRKTYKRLTGRSMPTNGFYDAGLAQFAGDPAAFVKTADDARAVARARKQKLVGAKAIECDYRVATPAKKRGLAPDIVNRLINEKVQANPALALKPKQELREMVIEQHGPSGK